MSARDETAIEIQPQEKSHRQFPDPEHLYVRVALPVPMHTLFDYRVPSKDFCAFLAPTDRIGCRVEVPFGPRKIVGFIMDTTTEPAYDPKKIRAYNHLLEETPIVDSALIRLAHWCSRFYFYPPGESIATMVPAPLRKGKPVSRYENQRWQLTSLGEVCLENPKGLSAIQQKTLALVHEHRAVSTSLLQRFEIRSNTLEAMVKKNLLEEVHNFAGSQQEQQVLRSMPPKLTDEQKDVCETILAQTGVHLLFGVTGAGKTEVYMSLIHACLARGQQALLLVPEIGLTPQTLARFHKRFNCTIAVVHSQQTDSDRTQEWISAQAGEAQLLIGTRSAVFTPLPRLGLIILDEEHDQSYKQQDGMRYSARDIAILRGHWETCSVILGSATPSLETLYNTKTKGYKLQLMRKRASGVNMPQLKLVDMRRESSQQGIADSVVTLIRKTLKQQRQILIFINRRGFAPAVICNDCGWTANCAHCDAKLTLHRQAHKMKCHHCELTAAIPGQCPMCQSAHLNPHGKGTERVEDTLNTLFDIPIIRIDRDTMKSQIHFENTIGKINTGQPMILLGTQMIAKGHDFLGVHLVVILDVDKGLFSSDFRAEEKTSQLLSQVSGRAGRGQQQGLVLVQTHQPDHPVFTHWLGQDYQATANYLLEQRQVTGLPPYSYHILIRAEATSNDKTRGFLVEARDCLFHTLQLMPEEQHTMMILGPVNAAMERRAGVHRAHLLLQGENRRDLHHLITFAHQALLQLPSVQKVRWCIEVDPTDF